ncbi:MAG: HAD family phosphatase [Nanoarchaeota archaeon]|nr:HAD family phosphatase [Nanoarchaeota archaeon]
MIKAIIFDMDGVLVDSTKYIWQSFNELVKKDGLHFDKNYIKHHLGRSLRDKLLLWEKEFGIKYDLDNFRKKSWQRQKSLMQNISPDKELVKLLKQAKKAGITMAVATSSNKQRTIYLLSKLKIRKYFDVIITSEDVSNHKPNPYVFIEAARKLKMEPRNCIVFEDAINGVQAAKNANMKVIALATEYCPRKDLKKAKPDKIINKFSELNIEKLIKI